MSEEREDLARYLGRHHSDQLRSIALSPDPRLQYPLYVDFAELMDAHPPLAHLLFAKPIEYLRLFNEAAIKVQDKLILDKLTSIGEFPDINSIAASIRR